MARRYDANLIATVIGITPNFNDHRMKAYFDVGKPAGTSHSEAVRQYRGCGSAQRLRREVSCSESTQSQATGNRRLSPGRSSVMDRSVRRSPTCVRSSFGS
jgi:hypothetical protein